MDSSKNGPNDSSTNSSNGKAEAYLKSLQRNLVHSLRRGQLEEAFFLLKKLQVEDPLSKATRVLELEVLIAQKKWNEARKLASDLVKLFPDSSRLFKLAGEVAYHEKNYSKALDYFTESEHLFSHKETQLWLGRTLTHLGQYGPSQALLEKLIPDEPRTYQALAWLFERQGHLEQAIAANEESLRHFPANEFSKSSLLRLKAAQLTPSELHEEIIGLEELGESLPLPLFATYVEKLLQVGFNQKVRGLISTHKEKLSSREGLQAAWVAYNAKAYDIAFDLFFCNFDSNKNQIKFLVTLEKAAKESSRVAELVEKYMTISSQEPRFHQRIKKLNKRLIIR